MEKGNYKESMSESMGPHSPTVPWGGFRAGEGFHSHVGVQSFLRISPLIEQVRDELGQKSDHLSNMQAGLEAAFTRAVCEVQLPAPGALETNVAMGSWSQPQASPLEIWGPW